MNSQAVIDEVEMLLAGEQIESFDAIAERYEIKNETGGSGNNTYC